MKTNPGSMIIHMRDGGAFESVFSFEPAHSIPELIADMLPSWLIPWHCGPHPLRRAIVLTLRGRAGY